MKTVGIVAEYNPFHNGHKYHIETAKEKSGADVCVAIMSGDFTQRGESACQDKWTRAKWALLNGVDLVIELPTVFATSDAGNFTKGSIDILERIGIDYVAFGIDTDEEQILKVHKISQEYRNELEARLKEYLKEGYSYPKAKALALGVKEFKSPNSILALGYLDNLKNAKPIMIPRIGGGYNDNQICYIPSATAIRALAKDGGDYSQFVPHGVEDLLNFNEDKVWEMAISKAMEMNAEDIDKINSADEGFGHLIKKVARSTSSYKELVSELKSKRYTVTRIKRFILQLVLGITREDVKTAASYVRVLGFNDKGSEFLKDLKKSEPDIEIITNVNKTSKNRTLDIDIRANDVYNLIYHRDLYENSDFVKKPVILTVDK